LTAAAAITTAGVVGGGTMGMGIAQVFATRGLAVTLVDSSREALARARSGIEGSLARLAAKGVPGAEPAAVLSRIALTGSLEALAAADFIVEAVVEDEGVKKRVFGDLDRLARPEAILASNTSSISITRLGAATRRAGLVIGMHFMNPVPIMELVEVVRGQSTSDAAHEATVSLARSLGKTPVTVSDYPGFVSNRVLLPMINEAVYALMEGVAGRDDIDQVFRLGMRHPMGPLQLADLIGLDVCLGILEVLQRGLGDPKYRPCPLLRRMVDAGHLGRKSGRGFYEYAEG
jgi:3-hydroxybutyryl-CoA dehydrogenase